MVDVVLCSIDKTTIMLYSVLLSSIDIKLYWQGPHRRSDGTSVPFLSANTLHMIDQALWMLPFTTKTDLEECAKQADVSVERRTAFLELIRAEHLLPGARAQLEKLWSTWLERNYPATGQVDERMSFQRAATPPDEDTAEATAALTAANVDASLPGRLEGALSAAGAGPSPEAAAASATTGVAQ